VIGAWFIHGHAIISDNDCIADATGATPPSLRNDADWRRFQAALDRAAVIVLGRLGHEANPNRRKRNRLVLSSSASGVERRDALWWNPAEAPVTEALAAAAPRGGIVAVPGGRRVFDLFLQIGFDAFDLARVHGLVIPDGVPIFSAVETGKRPENLLAAHGLIRRSTELLDARAGVGLALWRRP
jgi:hypothetical protein